MNEIWKDIPLPELQGKYQVSNLGRVKSLERVEYRKDGRRKPINEKILKPTLLKIGYYAVNLGRNNMRYVHRLIAEAFVENNQVKRTVNHKNGIKTDNRAENLEWATHGENNKHAYDTGLKTVSDKLRASSSKSIKVNGKDHSKSLLNLETGIYYSSIKEAALSVNMIPNTLQGKLLGRTKNNTPFIYV
ncbi:MAG: NUMOD4 motif-containing HNH endonuclease [Sphingobacterium sp.]